MSTTISQCAHLWNYCSAEGWEPETFASAQEFLKRPRPGVPSCLVLDVFLPGLNGLDLRKRVALGRTDMPIIFITDRGDVPTSVQAMKASAVEFLIKPFKPDVLVDAVRESLDRSRLALAREMQMHCLRDHYALLTRRERQVMALVVSGLLNKQIAEKLGISEITVKAHRARVMQKMQAKSLADFGNNIRQTRRRTCPQLAAFSSPDAIAKMILRFMSPAITPKGTLK